MVLQPVQMTSFQTLHKLFKMQMQMQMQILHEAPADTLCRLLRLNITLPSLYAMQCNANDLYAELCMKLPRDL